MSQTASREVARERKAREEEAHEAARREWNYQQLWECYGLTNARRYSEAAVAAAQLRTRGIISQTIEKYFSGQSVAGADRELAQLLRSFRDVAHGWETNWEFLSATDDQPRMDALMRRWEAEDAAKSK